MIDKCPQCGWQLDATPVQFSCPACDLEFDERSEAFTPPYPRLILVLSIVLLVVGAVTTHLLLLVQSNVDRAPTEELLVISLCLVYFAVHVGVCWWGLQIYLRGQVVAVLPVGLFVRVSHPKGRLISWNTICNVSIPRDGRSLAMKCRARLFPVRVRGVFRNRAEAERLKELIEDRLSAATTSSNDREPPDALP